MGNNQSQTGSNPSQSSAQRKRAPVKAPPVGTLDQEPGSAEYQALPQSFKSIVSQSNRYIDYFKSFLDSPYEQFQNSTINSRLWLLLNGKGITCQDCKTIVLNDEILQKHNTAYHPVQDNEEDHPASYLSPYRFPKHEKKLICPLGCTFTTTKGTAIRKHFVNDHSDTDINSWGYSRDKVY